AADDNQNLGYEDQAYYAAFLGELSYCVGNLVNIEESIPQAVKDTHNVAQERMDAGDNSIVAYSHEGSLNLTPVGIGHGFTESLIGESRRVTDWGRELTGMEKFQRRMMLASALTGSAAASINPIKNRVGSYRGAGSAGTRNVVDDMTRSAERASQKCQQTCDLPSNGVDLHLKYKSEWTAAQRAAADAKVKALTEADTSVVKNPARSGTAQTRYRKIAGLDIMQDADHLIDLQLGGLDDMSNLWSLDRSVNRSIGAQIQQLIKEWDHGTIVNRVTIGDP
ncbi:MAG: hypothetical protein MI741_09110, partial [Rhodospirillales bacterium]|nr:hypothetical protein [Rhodospirillales bacterium]